MSDLFLPLVVALILVYWFGKLIGVLVSDAATARVCQIILLLLAIVWLLYHYGRTLAG